MNTQFLATPTSPAPEAAPGSPLTAVLAPEVIAYRIEDTGFDLGTDLARLDGVRAVGAHEGVVLYCTRVVEAMALSTLQEVKIYLNPTLEELLRDLVSCRKMPPALKSWLNDLRHLGNAARHATRAVTPADADAAFVVLIRWLHWSFCEAPHGPRLPSLALPNCSTDALLPRALVRLMDDAEASGAEVLAQLTGPDPDRSPALLTPLIPAAAAEAMLGRGRRDEALIVLNLARGWRRFPRDLRLRQLTALYWSRRGKDERRPEHLHRARNELEPIPRTGAADEETFGILGGIYKRLADIEPEAAAKWLRDSHAIYRAGWERSQRTNPYLGINVATTALWLGRPDEVVEVAGAVRDGLTAQETRLREMGGEDRPLTYWDQAALAEAELLLGNWARAGDLYQDAFARFATRTDDIGVSVTQARLVLARLKAADRAGAVLGTWGG